MFLPRSAIAMKQKRRIEFYLIQARYELAAIYDRTSNGPSKEAPKPAPNAAPAGAAPPNAPPDPAPAVPPKDEP